MDNERFGRSTTVVRATHPVTGEIIDLDSPTPELARLLLLVDEHLRVCRAAAKAVKDELTGRIGAEPDRKLITGGVMLELRRRSESVWDVEELEVALQELIDAGTISAGDCTGIIDRTPHVHRDRLNRLVGQLPDGARQQVEACRHWQRRTSDALTIKEAGT